MTLQKLQIGKIYNILCEDPNPEYAYKGRGIYLKESGEGYSEGCQQFHLLDDPEYEEGNFTIDEIVGLVKEQPQGGHPTISIGYHSRFGGPVLLVIGSEIVQIPIDQNQKKKTFDDRDSYSTIKMSESKPEKFENFLGDFVGEFFGVKNRPREEWVFPLSKPKRKKDYYPEMISGSKQRTIYSHYLNGLSDEEIYFRLASEHPLWNFNIEEIGAVIELMNQLMI